MYYYTLKDNKIEQFAEIQGDAPSFMAEWLKTEDKIVRLVDGTLAFEKDVDEDIIYSEEKEMAKAEKIKAEQPTVEDLTEALAILTDIVLGGE